MKSFYKTLIVFFLFLSPLHIFSQTENENFRIDENQVVWQKTYETKLSKEALIDKIKTSGKFKNISLSENKLTAEIIDLSIDYKGYGESRMSIPIYLSKYSVKAFCMFEFKDNKYRATFKNIKFVSPYSDALSEIGETTEIETYALSQKNTEFKSAFLNKPSKILNFTFSKVTELKNNTENSKW
jgi:hypothetical protein